MCLHAGPPSLVVDGSGFVTGMEYYRMKADNSTLTKDNKELKAKFQKSREEFRQEYEKLKMERCAYSMFVHIVLCVCTCMCVHRL